MGYSRPRTYLESIGMKFGRLLIKSITGTGADAVANCICDCGKAHSTRVKVIKWGGAKSCGCAQLEKAKAVMSKYTYNHTFFVSNTPEMFYVLGLFYTDGNISPNRKRFRIGFKAEDKYLLEKIGVILKNSDKLEYNKTGNAYELSGSDDVIYSQLVHHGLTPRKSLTMSVKKHLLLNHHFWRGVIDGNGWISTGKGIVVGLCGTEHVCDSFIRFCNSFLDNKITNIPLRRTNVSQITIGSKRAIEILKVLYTDKQEWYLKRKHQKYIAYLRGETDELVL